MLYASSGPHSVRSFLQRAIGTDPEVIASMVPAVQVRARIALKTGRPLLDHIPCYEALDV